MAWDPAVYLRFADHRSRPAADLLARVGHAAPAGVLDLGCGPGNVTALLAERWPDARLTGVDNSPDMLAKARASGLAAQWIEADIAAFAPADRFDVIYSNATLHWLPDHRRLLPRLMGLLAPGGVLAVQMPRNEHRPLQALLNAMIAERGLADRPELRRDAVAAPEDYFEMLAPHAAAVDIWDVDYLHVLAGDHPALEWAKGTSLRPLMGVLDRADRDAFLAEYAVRLRDSYRRTVDGLTLFPFRRLFIVAQAA